MFVFGVREICNLFVFMFGWLLCSCSGFCSRSDAGLCFVRVRVRVRVAFVFVFVFSYVLFCSGEHGDEFESV